MSATGDAGFTLLEMLVVLAIAGLIGGIGFPRLQATLTGQEWRTAQVSVTVLLQNARAAAIRSGRNTRVVVASGGGGLQIENGAAITLPASVRVAMTAPIGFAADGSSRGGDITIFGRDRRRMVSVAPATGLLAQATP